MYEIRITNYEVVEAFYKSIQLSDRSLVAYFLLTTSYLLPLTLFLAGVKQFFLFFLRKAFIAAIGNFVEYGVDFVLRDG
jgi:hypothetical protein